jgi:hypothetical protein
MSADKNQARASSEPVGGRLVESLAARRRDDDHRWGRAIGRSLQRIDRAGNRFGHEDHAPAAAEGRIIHTAMGIVGKVAQIGY